MRKFECEAPSLNVNPFPEGLLRLGEKQLSTKKKNTSKNSQKQTKHTANLVEAMYLVIQCKYLSFPLKGP